jgi:hypothetical protein
MAEPTPFREEEGNTDRRDDSSQERAQNYGRGSAPVGSVAAPASLFLQRRNRIHPRGAVCDGRPYRDNDFDHER